MSREATVFSLTKNNFDFQDIKETIKSQKIAYTIEFYPEEGKYHYTGHRNCGVKHSPEETKKLGETCPVCGKPLTVGVLHRVEELASRKTEEVQPEDTQIGKAKGVKKEGRPPYVMLVPLMEILAEALGVGFSSQGVLDKYNQMVVKFGSELTILLETEVEEIQRFFGPRIAEGIKKVRERDIVVDPGFDGVFGTVKIWSSSAMVNEEGREEDQQMSLF
jgi:PHP family Zn ribbon phosphoesterase